MHSNQVGGAAAACCAQGLARLHALAFAALLVACGGGSSGGHGGAGDQPTPTPAACLALPQEITWHRDTLSSEWTDVLVDGRGRLWIAGWTNGIVGQTNLEPGGNSRGVLRALAADGSLLWDAGERFDTAGSDTLEALALGPGGTLYAAGRTTGSLGGAVNAGQFDSFVAWSDEAGDKAGDRAPWHVFQTGTPAPQHPRRIVADDRGGLVLAGEDDDYIPSNYLEAWTDAFALRLQRHDAGQAGDRMSLAWSWQAASPEPDIGGGLAVMPHGAGGATYLSGANGGGSARGMVLRKLDANGHPLWTARYTNTPVDHLAVVRAQADGTLLIAGSVFGSFHGGIAVGQQDIFVARVSADDGHLLQSWQYGSTGTDGLADLQIDAAGNLILFGETDGAMATGAEPAGSSDLFLLKLAPDGRVLAARQWGTAEDERAHRLALDRCGSVAAVGSSGGRDRRDALLWFWKA